MPSVFSPNNITRYDHGHKGIFVARQAVYGCDREVLFYRLLHRESDQDMSISQSSDRASSDVMIHSFMDMDIISLLGDKDGSIILTPNFVNGKLSIPWHEPRIVLELEAGIFHEKNVYNNIAGMLSGEYRVAVNLQDMMKLPEGIARSLSYVRMDSQLTDMVTLGPAVERCKEYSIPLLADKIESHDEVQEYQRQGFSWFSGYAFAKPKVISGRTVPANLASVMDIAKLYNAQDTNITEVEALVKKDVGLSYKLTKYLNSSVVGLNNKVGSLSQAIQYLGIKVILDWAILLSLSEIEDVNSESIMCSLMRAKMCEMAAARSAKSSEVSFTVGMFSALDLILGMPLAEILEKLPISNDVKDAILHFKGPEGVILKSVINYERCHWNRVDIPGLKSADIAAIYIEAVTWCDEVMKNVVSLDG